MQGDQAVLGRGVDDLLPEDAGAGAGLPRLDVDLDVAQRGHANQDGIGQVAERPDAVTGALRGDAQAVGRREAHDRLHVGGVLGDDDQCGVLLEGQVPGRTRFIPALVSGSQDGAANCMAERRDIDAGGGVRSSQCGPRFGFGEGTPARLRSRREQRPTASIRAPLPGVRSTGVRECGYP